jgi:aconitate hydratase
MSKQPNYDQVINIDDQHYQHVSFAPLQERFDLKRLPFAAKILLENLIRHRHQDFVDKNHIDTVARWDTEAEASLEIPFVPARVILQDFTGVPAIVDLAAMRDAMVALGGDPLMIHPLNPVELVIDHSVMVDFFGEKDAKTKNTQLEIQRNRERYQFLRWGQQAFNNFKVVPPGTGIVHQVNLEYLARVVFAEEAQKPAGQAAHKSDSASRWLFPDTLVGTDSHTTMINGLGVLGWGVGGIEAEAAMLGQPVSMLLPEVVGFELTGRLKSGITATDLVLTITEQLRQFGVVGKFVEFFGAGVAELTVADRATIANMAPEYGATCGLFPIDQKTIDYLDLSGRDPHLLKRVKAYAQAMDFWGVESQSQAVYHARLKLDLSKVEASIAGPKRPQDRIDLSQAASAFKQWLGQQTNNLATFKLASDKPQTNQASDLSDTQDQGVACNYRGQDFKLNHGALVIAAITSCTNTSNPSVLICAALLAKNAVARGLKVKPWVKTSFAPGSQVVTEYLQRAGLEAPLEALGFHLVGYGCTTCIGNSGPLPDEIAAAFREGKLNVASVLSGNRNFEGRIHSDVAANYLASPPLVVAYALAGNMMVDLLTEPLGFDTDGKPVLMKDIWPSSEEVQKLVSTVIDQQMFKTRYAEVYSGDADWKELTVTSSQSYDWPDSSYVKKPPFFEALSAAEPTPQAIKNARCLLKLGDSVTTDHISPAGAIAKDSPAAEYLRAQGVEQKDFNSYGSRRGNHEVMMRGTFANVRLRNQLAPGTQGGWTRLQPNGEQMSIFDAAQDYQSKMIPTIILAGKEYGTGSSRDWAAKGPMLLGVKAVIAESYERIHRSNLIGMGILPLQFLAGESCDTYQLTGNEEFSLPALTELQPQISLERRKVND